MILRRLRARVPIILACGLLFAGAALATTPVTRSQMESFVYSTMAAVITAAVLFGAGIIAWILARDRDLQGARFDSLTAEVRAAIAALSVHNGDPLAHTAASEHNHAPMNAQLDRIEQRGDETAAELHDLKRDHERINAACVIAKPWDGTERRGR